MPKIINSSARLRNFVKEFGEDIFSCDNAVLFCKVCGIKVSAEKKYNIQQHIARGKHIQQFNIRNQQEKPKSQVLVTDETTDVEERYIANVIIGTLEVDNPGKIFLLNSEVLEKANHSTISKLFDRSIFILWPEGVLHDNILLFNGESRKNFTTPYRINLFKNLAPGIPLPPEPIITRWSTWLNAVNYYCEHFLHIKNVILQLGSDDALAFKHAKQLVENPEIEANLIYIKSNFGFLANEITRLETSGMLLSESVCCIEKVKQQIKQASGKTGETKKLDDVLNKNSGFKILTIISNILSGQKERNFLKI
ncbi:hypothetical protein AGLY_017284 [Aphis glycines]|uniref:Uncharacterized protein n=1 Tax=Aphis glycines TaxID=307491 RepID=A0A6G0SW05_APHGL|nr:hypothetical protein AGLY_017284 [Aphis glycines]